MFVWVQYVLYIILMQNRAENIKLLEYFQPKSQFENCKKTH